MQALATNLAILMGNDLITNRLVGYIVAVISRKFALREAKLTEKTVRTKPRVEREYHQLQVRPTPTIPRSSVGGGNVP